MSDWSSDVCSSDLIGRRYRPARAVRLDTLLIQPAIDGVPAVGSRTCDVGTTSQCVKARLLSSSRLVQAPVGGVVQKDRKTVVEGESGSVRVTIGGRDTIQKTTPQQPKSKTT